MVIAPPQQVRLMNKASYIWTYFVFRIPEILLIASDKEFQPNCPW